jgi:DMSO/TMAO reductase YedYZ molybdopterin-dependent catalytic subunit
MHRQVNGHSRATWAPAGTVVLVAVAAATVAIGTISGCTALMGSQRGAGSNVASTPPSAEKLAASEVKQYHGQRLDSITAFVENSIKGPQYVDSDTYRLAVDGLVSRPRSFTYDQVVSGFRHYQKVVQLDCVEGWSVKILWEGPLVNDILATAGPILTAKTVIFHAYDGYSTSFPLEYFRTNQRIMAYKMNGQLIAPERGFPFMLVAEDKWGYKWCKWITRIELSPDPDYHGYWEQRGYSNDGSLSKPFSGP